MRNFLELFLRGTLNWESLSLEQEKGAKITKSKKIVSINVKRLAYYKFLRYRTRNTLLGGLIFYVWDLVYNRAYEISRRSLMKIFTRSHEI